MILPTVSTNLYRLVSVHSLMHCYGQSPTGSSD